MRLKMLRAMGIDVWFQRPTAATVSARDHSVLASPSSDHPQEPAREVAPLRQTPKSEQRVQEKTSRARRETPVPNPDLLVSAPLVAPQDPPSSAVTVDGFTLVCLKGSAALLISPAPVIRTRQRLARDIVESVAAIAGVPPMSPQILDFKYPPLQSGGDGSSTSSPERVLRAFLGRHLVGAVPPRILICADALPRFAGWFDQPYRVIPALDELYGDAGKKRGLWQDLLHG